MWRYSQVNVESVLAKILVWISIFLNGYAQDIWGRYLMLYLYTCLSLITVTFRGNFWFWKKNILFISKIGIVSKLDSKSKKYKGIVTDIDLGSFMQRETFKNINAKQKFWKDVSRGTMSRKK